MIKGSEQLMTYPVEQKIMKHSDNQGCSQPKAMMVACDRRAGHKKRQRARNRDLKRIATQDVLDRLPPFHSLPLAKDNGGDEEVEKRGLSDLYQPIPRIEASFLEFWATVPLVCNPQKAVLEGPISDNRELSMDRYHSEKYRRKLQYKKQRGDITHAQLEELWEKHGKRTKSSQITAANLDGHKQGMEGVSLLSNDRGQRKAWQVENFVSILWDRLSPYGSAASEKLNTNDNEPYDFTVVDFGCGSGNLCLALAPYFSRVRFVLVDKKPYPLKLAERRANEAGLKNIQTLQFSFSPDNLDDFSIPPISIRKRQDLFLPLRQANSENVDGTCNKQVASSRQFDIAIGLHCCGSFTDMVMSLAESRDADCIVCPCCNGSMTAKTTCGYLYPRSSYINKFMNQEEYLAISKLAEDRGIYNAKCLIEYDRALWAHENGYDVQLLKMTPMECTPKHHVLYLKKKPKN